VYEEGACVYFYLALYTKGVSEGTTTTEGGATKGASKSESESANQSIDLSYASAISHLCRDRARRS
jgi:hypothetical protein